MISLSRGPVSLASVAATYPCALGPRIGALYEAAQRSEFVFASPLGTFQADGAEHHVPRFVYFGPHTSQESVRLAILGGLGRFERVSACALLSFVEGLVRQTQLGQSLNLSVFPVVNVLGLIGGQEDRDLSAADWVQPRVPEIELLAREAQRASYQAFIRVTTSADDEPAAWVRTVTSGRAQESSAHIFSSELFAPWSVGFECLGTAAPKSGPLALAASLPIAPFEVELALPADWPQAMADSAVAEILQRLIIHYRAYLAFGQNL